jgi:hypothetical protein
MIPSISESRRISLVLNSTINIVELVKEALI